MRKMDKHIRGLWHVFSQKNELATITVEEFRAAAIQRGLNVVAVKEITYGSRFHRRAILLDTGEHKAIYPRLLIENDEAYQNNILPNRNHELFWKSVDWFFPPFIPRGNIYDPIKYHGIDIKTHSSLPKNNLQERFSNSLVDIYNLSNIIPTTEVTLIQSSFTAPHVPLIREAILAFYSGMKIVAIGVLIPIVENIFTKMFGSSEPDLVSIVGRCIDDAISGVKKLHYGDFTWMPDEYVDVEYLKVVDERVFMLETLRSWLVSSFYVKIESYQNISGFNRHIFAHAESDAWHNEDNFFRALGVIQALAFVEAYAFPESAVSILGPDNDPNCDALFQDVYACLNYQTVRQWILTAQKQSKGLPFNPTSSGDGWFTRAAILSNEMNNVLIPQLKERGWDCCEISDPEKNGEYVTVKSGKGDQKLNVALLFSCATDNSIYKELAKDHAYILYYGAQYHQKEFARDVDAIVRPINAWIAPENA